MIDPTKPGAAARCALLSDSTCDFSHQRALDRRLGIIPFHYAEAGCEDGLSGDDDLFQGIDPHEFYDAIRGGARPLTSQPSQLEYERAFLHQLEQGVPTVLFCITTGLSGGCEGARMALARLREEHPEHAGVPLYIVDASVTSTPQNLLVEAACNLRDHGCSAEQVRDWAEEAKWRLQTLFMVEDLDALHRGGRVPKSVAAIGGALDVKPLLSFDLEGRLVVAGVARGRKKGLKRLAKNFERNHRVGDEGLVVAIGDADCPEDGDRLAAHIATRHPDATILRSTIGPTIGSHVGPGMVSCCFWGQDRRGGGDA